MPYQMFTMAQLIRDDEEQGLPAMTELIHSTKEHSSVFGFNMQSNNTGDLTLPRAFRRQS